MDWGVLVETGDRGTFSPAAKIGVPRSNGIGPWLLEAGLVGSGRREYPLRALVGEASLYPIDLAPSARELSRNPWLELCRQGLDEDMVVLKG